MATEKGILTLFVTDFGGYTFLLHGLSGSIFRYRPSSASNCTPYTNLNGVTAGDEVGTGTWMFRTRNYHGSQRQ